MKTKHLFEDACYLIGNKAVAKCFLFGDEKDCIRFRHNIDHHLGEICEILAYGFSKDEFQMVIKMKSRKEIEDYYKNKYSKLYNQEKFIPETTYIFAQAMANLQSGYAKYFNFRYDRDGGLMKGRYNRVLIESELHLRSTIDQVHALHESGKRSRIWTFRRKEDGFNLELIKEGVNRSSRAFYEGGCEVLPMRSFQAVNKIDLRGQFENLPQKSLNNQNSTSKVKNLISFMFLKSF